MQKIGTYIINEVKIEEVKPGSKIVYNGKDTIMDGMNGHGHWDVKVKHGQTGIVDGYYKDIRFKIDANRIYIRWSNDKNKIVIVPLNMIDLESNVNENQSKLYHDTFKKLAPGFDPRHIEAWIRTEYDTLDNMSPKELKVAVEFAKKQRNTEGPRMSEQLAKSYGL
jgi:hypothetical protein